MKKIALLIALIALVAIPVFAMDFTAVGLQLGTECGAVGEYEITEKIDGYITANWSFNNKRFNAAVAGLYDIADIDVGLKTPFDFAAGLEVGVGVSKGTFVVSPKIIASLAYDFKIQELSFTAFARLGLGVDVIVSKSPSFGGSANIGIVYNL